MPLDFPSSPTTGQIFTGGGATWAWDGAKWTAASSGTAGVPSTPTVLTSGSGTYIVPVGTVALQVELVGGGGGGGGQGTSGQTAGGAGGDTTFGALTAGGGAGGPTTGTTHPAGGTALGGDVNIVG